MPEPTVIVRPAAGGLGARLADVAIRLAGLVEASCTPESGAPAAVRFLRNWAESATPDRDPDRFDPLARAYRLADDDRLLLLLALLPEEHEGLAGTFRSLHPR